MGRPAKFDTDLILDAAATVIAEGGPARATIGEIATQLGAPSGSIYHRFESRDLMFACLWIRTARRAQLGFIEALARDDLERAAQDAALHMPRWSRDHLAEAMVMLLYRREDLAERWPDQLGDELASLNVGVARALQDFSRRRYGTASQANMEVVRLALLSIPYAGVRQYLASGQSPPPRLDRLIEKAAMSVLDSHKPRPTRSDSRR